MAEDAYVPDELFVGDEEMNNNPDSEPESAKPIVLGWQKNKYCAKYHTLSLRMLKAIRCFEDYHAISMEWRHGKLNRGYPTNRENPITKTVEAIKVLLDELKDSLNTYRDTYRDPRSAQAVLSRWYATPEGPSKLRAVEDHLSSLKLFYKAACVWNTAMKKPIIVLRERSWEFASRKFVVQQHHASEPYQINQYNTDDYWLYKSHYEVVDDIGKPSLIIEEQMLDMDTNRDGFQLPKTPYQTEFRL
jgi:hypothetical protein